MHDLIQTATVELSDFLAEHLPPLGENWWKTHVEFHLSFQQQRRAEEHGLTTLEELDFAALLRVFDRNWHEFSYRLNLPREGRNWARELQTVRNRWAHLPARAINTGDVYRDADTLGRFLDILNASPMARAAVALAKKTAINEMAGGESPVSELSQRTPARRKPTGPETEATGGAPGLQPVPTTYQVGDLVALRSDRTIIVPIIEVMPGGAETRYKVFRDGRSTAYYESQLRRPEQAGESPHISADKLRAYLTSLHLLSPSVGNLYSLRSGRVQFVPYQYRPVLRLIRADRPRLLIADEVGVGKTIEAGLIIKELRARMDISSVLVICPKALVSERKWFLEMKRFDEHFTALDGRMLRHCLRESHLEGEWPQQYAKAIVPFSLFDSDLIFGKGGKRNRQSEGLLALDPPPRFDLVIVDEAHHIRNPETYLHHAVRYFCDNAHAAVFLTATPLQLGKQDLFTLLNVLRPDLVIDRTSFDQMAAPNPFINEAVEHCRSARKDWRSKACACIGRAAQTEWGRLFLRESPQFQEIYDQLRDERADEASRIRLIHSLEALYTFSPMINRTRRRDIGEFTTRKPETLTIEFTSVQQRLHDDLLKIVARILMRTHGQSNVQFMMTTIRRQAASCLYGLAPLLQEILEGKLESLETMYADNGGMSTDPSFLAGIRGDIEALLESVRNLDPEDPKIDAFVGVLQDKGRMTNNKVLAFSTFRHTLAYIQEHVNTTKLRYGLVHGGVADEERAELRRRFALPKEDPDALDVLLSSEVGGEGLDFQFCDLLVNYDLPWNPMRVEQRIGRIDRYGQQSKSVAIVNLVTPGTVDADIYERCLLRIGVFHHAVGGSEEILGEITQEIRDIAHNFNLTAEERADRLQQLADNKIRQMQEESNLEERQAELFGLTVPDRTWQEEIKKAESFWLSPTSLQRCVSTYLSGLTETEGAFLLGEKPLKTLRLNRDIRTRLLNDLMRESRSNDPVSRQWQKWLKGADPLLSITFEQETATAKSRAIHLNILHPLVRQAARSQQRSQPVRVSLAVPHATLPPGKHSFALYHWRKVGVRGDDTIVAIASEPKLDSALMSLLQAATDAIPEMTVEKEALEEIDARHHGKWSAGLANHADANQKQVEHRLQSLRASHQARCNLLRDQAERAKNDRIHRMKQAELERAGYDYERRVAELQRATESADIHATQVVAGVLQIMPKRT